MNKGKSTWKYNKLLTPRRNYFPGGGGLAGGPVGVDVNSAALLLGKPTLNLSPINMPTSNDVIARALSLNNSLNNNGSIEAIAGGLSGIIGAGMSNAKIGDTSTIENDIALARSFKSNADNYDSLLQEWLSYLPLQLVSYDSVRGLSDGLKAGNAFKGLASGAGAGFLIGGPVGALIGAAVGAVSSGIGAAIEDAKALKKTKDLNHQIIATNDFVENSLLNNASNIETNNTMNLLRNYKSFGGGLDTAGGRFSTGLVHIDNGGNHEENPHEGVLIGIDPQGIPNLVEEGETIFNDYVFSKRLRVPKALAKKYKLGGEISFADASKKLAKESEERPNDPISKNGLEALMQELTMALEELKTKQQLEEANALFNSLPPELLVGIMDLAELTTEQQAVEELAMQLQMMQELIMPLLMTMGMPMGQGFAKGGHLYSGTDTSTNYIYKLLNEDGTLSDMPSDFSYWATPLNGRYWSKVWGDKYTYYPGIDSGNIKYFIAKTPKKTPVDSYYVMGEDGQYVLSSSENPRLDVMNRKLALKNSMLNDTGGYDYYWGPDEPQKTLPTWMESVEPAIHGVAGLFSELSPLWEGKYPEATAIKNAASKITYDPVTFNPVGNRLTYTPYDLDTEVNMLNAASNANARNLANLSGGNRGAASASLLANQYNTLNAIGNARRQAIANNFARLLAVEDFNSRMNLANSEGIMLADLANQAAAALARQLGLSGLITAMEYQNKDRMATAAGRSAVLSNIAKYFGNQAKTNKYLNNINNMPGSNYKLKADGSYTPNDNG